MYKSDLKEYQHNLYCDEAGLVSVQCQQVGETLEGSGQGPRVIHLRAGIRRKSCPAARTQTCKVWLGSVVPTGLILSK